MKIQLMDIKRQHEHYKAEYEEAALNILRSGNYIGGQEVDLFEKEFATYEGAKFGISCGNGTDAIIIALRALGIGPGDEVIVPAWTFFATAESVAAVGATPVFVDVDEKTYCMNSKLIEQRITNKTKAVLPVHFYGNCCEMDDISEICKKHKLSLICDCAQSTGTRFNGSRANTLGDIACFSFFPTKNLGCDGDGGMILTNNEELANICRSLKVHGSGKLGLEALKKNLQKSSKALPADLEVGESKYFNYLIGYNSRLDAIQAAILRKKLTHINEFVDGRRRNAMAYNKAFGQTSLIVPFAEEKAYHSYYIYALKHKKSAEIIEKLKERDIGTGVYYPVPLHLQGAFYYLGYKKGDFPVAEALAKETFVLPVFPELTEAERSYIIHSVLEILEELK